MLREGLVMDGNRNEFFLSGKKYFRINGILMAAAGISVIIAAALAIHNSGGNYIAGIYGGISSVLLGLSLLNVENYSSFWVLAFCIATNFILVIVGLGISASNQDFINSLEACGSYQGSITDSCGLNSYVECSGNSDYYYQAYLCELAYAQDNDGTIEDDQCSCVTDSANNDDTDSYTCYDFNNINSCSDFLNLVPGQIGAAIAFLTLSLLLTLALISLLVINKRNPNALRTPEENAEYNARQPEPRQRPVVTTTAVAGTGAPVVIVGTPLHAGEGTKATVGNQV